MKTLLALLVPVAVFGLLSASSGSAAGAASADSEPSTSSTAAPSDTQRALTQRLGKELGDKRLAARVVAGLSPGVMTGLAAITGGDFAGSPKLSYSPSRVPDKQVDSLWVFSYGFRISSGPHVEGVEIGETPPPMNELTPGPTNAALAKLAAEFVKKHPVPVIAQWEVADELRKLGAENVISVEPDMAPDGSVIYLSTDGVAKKGLKLAAAAGISAGHAGVLCHADHVVRCLMTVRANGITADVPKSATLPARYDSKSGQIWTRQRETWIPVDLLGRTILG